MRRRAAISVVAVLSLLLGTLGLAVPAQAVAGNTALTLVGEAGDYITQGSTYSYSAGQMTVSRTGTAAWASFGVDTGAGNGWNLDFRAPSGGTLTAGTTYTGATNAFSAPSGPGISITGMGRGCSTMDGSFTVHEIAVDSGTGAVTAFAATFDQVCDGQSGRLVGSFFYNSVFEDSTLSASGPTSAVPGSQVTVTGSLAAPSGAIASAPIGITRTDAAGETTLAGTTTGSDGTFSFQDTIGASDVTYALAYAGDATRVPASATVVVQSNKLVSTLALSAPTSVKRGTTYSLTGTLKSGGVAVANATVTLSRTDLKGTTSSTLKTSASGTFTKKDTPAVGGTVAWTVSWTGSATQAAVSAKRSVTVPRAATALSITTDKSLYSYGAKATVRAKLGTTYNGRTVAIYAKKATSSSWTLIKKGTVSSTGYLTAYYTMTAKTSFKAVYAGDYRYAPATKYVTPNTKAKIVMQVFGGYAKSGGYTLIGLFDTAYFLATVKPARPGGCVNFVAQTIINGSWQTYDSVSCATLDANSQYAVYIAGNGYAGKVRVRASVGSSSTSAGNVSPWGYAWFR